MNLMTELQAEAKMHFGETVAVMCCTRAFRGWPISTRATVMQIMTGQDPRSSPLPELHKAPFSFPSKLDFKGCKLLP